MYPGYGKASLGPWATADLLLEEVTCANQRPGSGELEGRDKVQGGL